MSRGEARDGLRWTARRRGAALVAVVLVLAMVHLAVIGSVVSGGDEAHVASLRVETARAFYAGESGALIVVKSLLDGVEPPEEGAVLLLPGVGAARVEFIAVPEGDAGGEIIVEGRSGYGCRRLSLLVE